MATKDDEVIFVITKQYLQKEARERINRELNDEELKIAKNCIHDGLMFDIDTLFETAIDEATQ